MPGKLTNARVTTLVLAVSLGGVIALSSVGSPPQVSISRLPMIEDGLVVCVIGILADLWIHDSGSEYLVMADIASPTAAKVVCSPGLGPMPSTYMSIGDELQVTGELSNDRAPPTVFASSDDVTLLNEAAHVVTPALLATHWWLFQGDAVDVTGILVMDYPRVSCRLVDQNTACSIGLSSVPEGAEHMDGKPVVVSGTFMLDQDSLTFLLDPRGIRIAA